MKERDKYTVVAEAVRVEYDKDGNDVFLVFRITDEKFKQQIKKDWTEDVDLKMIDRKLIVLSE